MRNQNFQRIGRWLSALLLAGASTAVWSQVTIQRNGIDVPQEKVDVLYRTTFQVVAQEFRLPSSANLQFPVTLILGDRNERVLGDEVTKVYAIYMERWDEAKFALGASRIAIQHLVSEERKTRLVADILRRSNQIAPVSPQAARGEH